MRFRFNHLMEAEPEAGAAGAPGSTLTDAPPTPAEAAPAEPAAEVAEWMKGMDAEYSGNASMQHIPDLNTLAKNYIHAQKMMGKDKVVIPDHNASDEDREAFFDKLGRPKHGDYKVSFEEAGYDEDFQKGFIEQAHKSGMMPEQAQGLLDYFHNQVTTASTQHEEASAAAVAKGMEDLKTEWGVGFDKNLGIAKTAVDTLTDDSFKAYLNESGLGNDPRMIKMFTAIGNQLNEDTFDRKAVGHLGTTKDEAQEKINSIMSNQDHAYWKKEHANHANAVAEMSKYNEIVHG